jgi:hypothetical protein
MSQMFLVPPGSDKVVVKCGPDCAVFVILPHGPIKHAIQHSISRARLEVLLLGMQHERQVLKTGDADVDGFEAMSAEVRATFWRGMCQRAMGRLEEVQDRCRGKQPDELNEIMHNLIQQFRDALS